MYWFRKYFESFNNSSIASTNGSKGINVGAITDTGTTNVGVDIGAKYLFTDYLDDVGGTYMNVRELQEGNGDLAAALGNRTGELEGSDPVDLPTGTQRGDNKNNDFLFTAQITLSYNFLDTGLVGSRGRRGRGKGCRSSNF